MKDAYPIATFTWLLCYKKNPDPKKAEVLRNLLLYCLTDGQKESEALGYLPLAGSRGRQGERPWFKTDTVAAQFPW